jgi:hypothetical protein
VILKSETYHFHRLDLTRQTGFIVTVYDEDGLRLAATMPASTPAEAFREARKLSITKSRGRTVHGKVPSRFSHLVERLRWRQNRDSDLGRQDDPEVRIREAGAAKARAGADAPGDRELHRADNEVSGGKSTSDPYGLGKHRCPPARRNSENTPR